MKSCSVLGCSGPTTPNPVYFEFPSSRLLRKRWLDAINCPSAEVGAAVCIRHFTRADYQLVRGEATLRTRSVPSRRITESDDEESDSESDSEESVTSNTTRDKNNANDNGTTHNDNGDNGQINNDNGNNEKDGETSKRDTQIENGTMDKDNSCTEKANTENGDDRLNNEDNGNINEDNGKIDVDNEKVDKDNGKLNEDNGKINEDNDNGKLNNVDGKVNNDNGNNITKGRKTRCKITALRAINGRRKFSFSSDSTNSDSVNSSPRPTELEGIKVDIEESLQHYYIENKKTERQVAAMTDVIQEPQEMSEESRREDNEIFDPSAPVFIELSVGQGSKSGGQDPAESDCLMVLESVQCDVDPALLLAAREEDENVEQVDLEDDDDDEPEFVERKKEDPISLLTSSDEDDVIIQEPKYDTVEVSSADTSEDDMPLVKLVKPSSKSSQTDAKMKYSAKHTKNLITKLLWGRNDFYCVHCRFTTANASEYTKHMATHNAVPESQHKIIQYCQDCGFTTSSKHQMQKHKQKHKNEKRFKCPKCNYSAKHEMSLVYHMKTHKNSGLNEVEVAICGTYEPTSAKSKKSKKIKSSERSKVSESDKKYRCKTCGYKTNRRSDLKRHRRRIHDGDYDDEEYVP